MARIVVGLSGGVDSSVAAWLLHEQGHEVIAVYMVNWHDTVGVLEGSCKKEEDVQIAEMVAKKIGIPFHIVDLSQEYRSRVVDYLFREYQAGRTPNPDVLCNREIKFDAFVQAIGRFQADYVATGHYCRKERIEKDGKPWFRLLAGKDQQKDQSYFLCQLSQEQLAKVVFPVGDLTKQQVRELAGEAGLPSADKKDSQGICFVGKVDLPTFLQQKLEAKKGKIVEIPRGYYKYHPKPSVQADHRYTPDELTNITSPFVYEPEDGIITGEHQGAHFYTIGQRKGLKVGGRAEPLFVIGTDIHQNIVYVAEGHAHPGLNRQGLFIRKEDIHWVRPDLQLKPGELAHLSLRIRYRQELQMGTLLMKEEGAYIIFQKPQRGITPGQFAVWYDGDELLGSGVIFQ
ncbi:MAG: tRNA 2-thiouridine(34) synthase MnmA [Bacteroidetes bacterium]|nr:tRNA 2-thiouridine(34) synthase MnmA [Bacteroidota bacterium]